MKVASQFNLIAITDHIIQQNPCHLCVRLGLNGGLFLGIPLTFYFIYFSFSLPLLYLCSKLVNFTEY